MPGPPFSARVRLHNPRARGTGSPSPGGASSLRLRCSSHPVSHRKEARGLPGLHEPEKLIITSCFA